MSQAAGHRVKVAGGSIYYSTQGSGPVLVIMGGSPSNADTLKPLASQLAEDFTVVTYDRRGCSRSQMNDPPEPAGTEPASTEPADPGAAGAGLAGIPRHADDARQLIGDLGSGPVSVFGTSFGALIALELAAAAPADISLLVVHEPPLGQLLADGERQPFELNLDSEKDAAAAVGGYRLDLDRLRPVAGRLVVAGSEDSRDFYPYQCARQLARHLGIPLRDLPGNHAGMVQHPAQFATQLRSLLQPPVSGGIRITEHQEGVTK